eukprot:8723674-Lingulodinium_polyedra.AAC.1
MPSSAQAGGRAHVVQCPLMVYASCSTEGVRHGDWRLTTGGVCMTRMTHPSFRFACTPRTRSCARVCGGSVIATRPQF